MLNFGCLNNFKLELQKFIEQEAKEAEEDKTWKECRRNRLINGGRRRLLIAILAPNSSAVLMFLAGKQV